MLFSLSINFFSLYLFLIFHNRLLISCFLFIYQLFLCSCFSVYILSPLFSFASLVYYLFLAFLPLFIILVSFFFVCNLLSSSLYSSVHSSLLSSLLSSSPSCLSITLLPCTSPVHFLLITFFFSLCSWLLSSFSSCLFSPLLTHCLSLIYALVSFFFAIFSFLLTHYFSLSLFFALVLIFFVLILAFFYSLFLLSLLCFYLYFSSRFATSLLPSDQLPIRYSLLSCLPLSLSLPLFSSLLSTFPSCLLTSLHPPRTHLPCLALLPFLLACPLAPAPPKVSQR